jgi:hypothetical protein
VCFVFCFCILKKEKEEERCANVCIWTVMFPLWPWYIQLVIIIAHCHNKPIAIAVSS